MSFFASAKMQKGVNFLAKQSQIMFGGSGPDLSQWVEHLHIKKDTATYQKQLEITTTFATTLQVSIQDHRLSENRGTHLKNYNN